MELVDARSARRIAWRSLAIALLLGGLFAFESWRHAMAAVSFAYVVALTSLVEAVGVRRGWRPLQRALRVGVDTVPLDVPLGGLGLDSLMALGVRNRIEHELALPVPIVQFLQSPSLQDFASHLLQRMILEQVVVSPTETALTDEVDDEEWEVVSI